MNEKETATNVIVVDYQPRYAHELVEMWRASFERAVGIVDPNPVEKQLEALEQRVVPENRVVVVLYQPTSAVIGFMAYTPEKIDQLYIHTDYQGMGIGTMLLERAKRESSGRLRLSTFKANETAQRFYEHRGFKVVRRGFEQRWQLEDIEYEWSAADRAGSIGRVEQFLQKVTEWATDRSDIQAVALVGSHARNEAAEDSDVALVIVATQPGVYLRNTAWVQRFGPIKRHDVEDYGRVTSLRVWYGDGLEVEYGLTDETWAALPIDEGTRDVISRGMRVLFERGGMLSRHLPNLRGWRR